MLGRIKHFSPFGIGMVYSLTSSSGSVVLNIFVLPHTLDYSNSYPRLNTRPPGTWDYIINPDCNVQYGHGAGLRWLTEC